MTILTVNTGSSSARLVLFVTNGKNIDRVAYAHFKAVAGEPEALLRKFVDENSVKEISAVAHRVVHGGTKFTQSSLIDDEVEMKVERLSVLAPLHNPIALKWIHVCKEYFGSHIPQVAIFDTAFYAGLPKAASTYALPEQLRRGHEIRRYGFHGLAHASMLKRWLELRPDTGTGGRVISLQLGAGCSITALKDGRAVDTSMGFSPLEGLVMATRSGDIDPGIMTFLMNTAGMDVSEIEKVLNQESGLLGLSGISSDMRLLLETDNSAARLAVDIYCYRAKKYIGAYSAVLGGVDAILFGGGVGENAPVVRGRILEDMQWCGIALNHEANVQTVGKEGNISSEESRIDIMVIPVDESFLLASEAQDLLEGMDA